MASFSGTLSRMKGVSVAFLTLALSGAGLALAPAALADGVPAHTPAVVIGPIRAQHGFLLTITDYDCRAGHTNPLQLVYTRGSSKASIGHSYFDPRGSVKCSVSRSLSAGRLDAAWGKLLRIRVSLHASGRAKSLTLPKPCSERGGSIRPAIATGTVAITIRAGALGRIHVRRAKALIERSGTVHCKPTPGEQRFVYFDAPFNGAFLGAEQPPSGPRTVQIGEPDDPGSGVVGNVFASFSGKSSLFNAAPGFGSATIGADPPLLTGSMSFTATSPCTSGTRTGTLSGTLVLHDPVLGALTLAGSQTSSPPTLGRSGRSAGC